MRRAWAEEKEAAIRQVYASLQPISKGEDSDGEASKEGDGKRQEQADVHAVDVLLLAASVAEKEESMKSTVEAVVAEVKRAQRLVREQCLGNVSRALGPDAVAPEVKRGERLVGRECVRQRLGGAVVHPVGA